VAERLLDTAKKQLENDQLRAALASADRALSWEPDSFESWHAYVARAEIREEMKDNIKDRALASLDDLNEAIKRLEDPARAKQPAPDLCDAYAARAGVFQRLGRYREAIADCTTALNMAPGEARWIYLNQRAYFQALANIELDQALQDVQASLNSRPGDAEIIDTRGYVLFRLGQYDAALKDLQQALSRLGGNDNLQFRLLALDEFSPRARRRLQEAIAVMLHHRGEIRKKLGQEALGDQDIHKAERMGYDPERGVD
jgi:tetratricopeptide (TPR) repeat protein